MSYDANDPDSIRPRKWARRNAFYFDDSIALMMGYYDGAEHESMGMRWMDAEGPQGYPVTRGYPQWMVTPNRLALYILEGIANDPLAIPHVRDRDEFNRALTYLRGRRA